MDPTHSSSPAGLAGAGACARPASLAPPCQSAKQFRLHVPMCLNKSLPCSQAEDYPG